MKPISSSVRGDLQARNRHLMELGVRSGDRLFDAEAGLLRLKHPTHPAYTGIAVAQTPLEYAIALFETGGDEKRANRLIRRTLDFQDRDIRSPTYGNFRWMTHWTTVQDRNAVSFMTPNYAYIWRHHRASLQAETRERLEEAFPLVLRGVLTHRVSPSYTNIFLLNIFSKLELAAILGDRRVLRDALSDWNAWGAEVSAQGIAEYNSPCYTAVDLFALEGILEMAPSGEFRRQAEKLLEYVWTEFAANYHAGIRCLTGPMSRTYPMDYLYGNGLSAIIAYQQFGSTVASFDSNGGLTPFVVNFALHEYVVSDSIRAIAVDKAWPVTVRGYVPSRRISWTNYLARDFTLGSQTGYYCPQEMPVFLAFRTRRKRRSLFFKSDPPVPVLASTQDGNLLLGGFSYPDDVDWSHYGEGKQALATISLHLGETKRLRQRIVPACKQGESRMSVDSSRPIALDLGSVFVGIKAFLVGPAGEEAGVALERRGIESLIVWQTGPRLSGRGKGGSPVAGFFILVGDKNKYVDLKEFARHLEGFAVSTKARPGGVTLAVQGHSVHVSVQAPPSRPRVAKFLHFSPYLHLRSGDLRKQMRSRSRR